MVWLTYIVEVPVICAFKPEELPIANSMADKLLDTELTDEIFADTISMCDLLAFTASIFARSLLTALIADKSFATALTLDIDPPTASIFSKSPYTVLMFAIAPDTVSILSALLARRDMLAERVFASAVLVIGNLAERSTSVCSC